MDVSLKLIDYKLITMTLSCYINYSINLLDIGLFIKIDNDIIGLKYNFGKVSFCKGIYLTSASKRTKIKKKEINPISFYNQISMIININNHHINVKIFKNGTLHLTGCKNSNEGNLICNLLITNG